MPGTRSGQLADSLRADGRRVIVVECGWPRGGADLVTFGASLTVSAALAGLLAPQTATRDSTVGTSA